MCDAALTIMATCWSIASAILSRTAESWRAPWRHHHGSIRGLGVPYCERSMNDFWPSCGHHLLDRDRRGRLGVTEEFMKAYFARPELVPPADACTVERTLYHALSRDP